MPAPACHRCASLRIRRVKAAGLLQRTVRELTPLRRYLCLECGHRGWSSGRVPWDDPAPAAPRSARPIEERDLVEAADRRRRFVASLLVAVGAGALVALVVSGFFGP